MRRASVALALLLASCAVAPLSTPAPSSVQTGGSLRVAVGAEITSLDPWTADAASLVATRQIFETLVGLDAGGVITAGLASAWQLANDGATWTLTLRDGIHFHDGSPLDAATVVASFERGRGSRSYAMLFDDPPQIVRVSAVDARTVRFDLRTAFGPFLAHLAGPQTAIARGTAGTGPFLAKPDALAPDGTLTLQRNDAYRQKSAAGPAMPYLAGLVLRPVRDPASRLAELRAGRVDVALDLPVAQALAARGDPNLVLALRPYAALASLGVDTAAIPFDRPEIRRAVAMSLDREPVLRELCDRFAERLFAFGHTETSRWPYAFAKMASGASLTPDLRALWDRAAREDALSEPPFNTEAERDFLRWLGEPEPIEGREPLSRYLTALYHSRPELRTTRTRSKRWGPVRRSWAG